MRVPYERLLNEGKIYRHKTSKKEIRDLLEISERDLKDASIKELSADRRFATAYNAALQMATIVMHCEGYRSAGLGHHSITFQFMKTALEKEFTELADYFDRCRRKRNITDYDRAGRITEKEANDLLREATNFLKYIKQWIKANHPGLL
jgi:uncharacterized protein (UPF0332 family)